MNNRAVTNVVPQAPPLSRSAAAAGEEFTVVLPGQMVEQSCPDTGVLP